MRTVDSGIAGDQRADPIDGDTLWFNGRDHNLKRSCRHFSAKAF
jgi:hypothetical protein